MPDCNNIKLICFDLDDTLWPCLPTIYKAEQRLYQWLSAHKPEITAKYALDDLRRKRIELVQKQPEIKHDLSEIRKLSLRQLAIEFNTDSDWVDGAFDVFYQARQEIDFYEDVEPVLISMKKKYSLASMTNGNADIHRTSLGHLFDYSLSAETSGSAKPDSVMFLKLIRLAHVSADEILFIGDHPVHDIEGSHAVGITNIWLNRQSMDWSHQSVQPDHTIQSLYEVLPFLGLESI